MAAWLRYNKTLNCTNLMSTKSLKDLEDANFFLKHDWRVFLFVNAQLLATKTQSDWSFFPNHYVAMLSEVTFQWIMGGEDQYVKFNCSSWGRTCRVPQHEELGGLSGRDFCKNFYGYVAAKF